MNHVAYALLCLLWESVSSRRDAQIRFLREENCILRSRIKSHHLVLSPEERSRLLAIGAEFQHKVRGLITVVAPRTYKRWLKEHREGRSPGRVGRPRSITKTLRELIIRLARENPGWGYLRIVGELIKLRCPVGKSSVRRVLREEGGFSRPRPDQSDRPEYQPWGVFMKIHMNTLVACDFFVKNICTFGGQRPGYVFAFVHVGTRRVWCSPSTLHPTEDWVKQQARNFMMWLEDQGLEATHLIHDRDTKFTRGFDRLLRTADIQIVNTPFLAPNANAYAESWIASIRRECLDHFWCFGLRHLDHLVQTYVEYYNRHRPHQSLGNQVLSSRPTLKLTTDRSNTALPSCVGCRLQLGGLLKHYYRRAA